jgi:glycosyltransferase involved in cell wall biosynthesis
MSKLTVVLLTYNRASFLGSMLESLRQQTYKGFKLIVLDNASTDTTAEIVAAYKKQMPLEYIKNEKNIPFVDNWNKGLALALQSGSEYFSLAHDDDIFDPQMFEKQIRIMDSNRDVPIVATNMRIINSDGSFKENGPLSDQRDSVYAQYEYIQRYFQKQEYLPCPSVMFRSDFMKKNELRFSPDVGGAADTHLWFRINILPGKIYCIGERLLQYRNHNQKYDQINLAVKLGFHTYRLLLENKLYQLLPLLNQTKNFNFHFLADAVAQGLDQKHSELLRQMIKQGYFAKGFSIRNKLYLMILLLSPTVYLILRMGINYIKGLRCCGLK